MLHLRSSDSMTVFRKDGGNISGIQESKVLKIRVLYKFQENVESSKCDQAFKVADLVLCEVWDQIKLLVEISKTIIDEY